MRRKGYWREPVGVPRWMLWPMLGFIWLSGLTVALGLLARVLGR